MHIFAAWCAIVFNLIYLQNMMCAQIYIEPGSCFCEAVHLAKGWFQILIFNKICLILFFSLIKKIVKPIFHRKLGSRWLPNANDIDTKHMKCTWPMQAPTRGDPSQTIFHWLTLGPWGFALGPQGFLDTNMLVSPTRNGHVGGLNQRDG